MPEKGSPVRWLGCQAEAVDDLTVRPKDLSFPSVADAVVLPLDANVADGPVPDHRQVRVVVRDQPGQVDARLVEGACRR